MNLTLVPYGNARKVGDKFECQHGEKECEGNRWEQCAIEHFPETAKHFPFYNCVEKSNGSPDFKTVSENCAKETGLEFDVISKCFNSDESQQLQDKYAALTPAHQYTPWVLFNGEVAPTSGTFLRNLCKAWAAQGGDKPNGCKILDDAKPEPCSADW